MNRSNHVLWLGLVVALGWAPQLTLAAETSALLEEVVVTARKREETAQSVPIPITAVTDQQLAARSIRDITDIERLSPNTDISSSSVNSSATQVFIRGIGQVNWASTQDPKIGIYVDGVYLSRAQGGLLDLMDIERVEVLRGPQGTLFGRNTTAGLIHLVTNKPNDQEMTLDVEAGVGTDKHRTYGFVYNQPLGEGLAMRFSLYDREADGFIINSLTGNDRGNDNALSYRGSLAWTPGAHSVQFTYDHFEADERAALASCRFTAPEDGNQAQVLGFIAHVFGIYDNLKANCRGTNRHVSIDNTNNEALTTDVDAFTLTQRYEFDRFTIDAISAYREIDNFNGSWGWVMGSGPGANLLEVLNNDSEHEIFSQELRVSGSTERFNWVAGVYYFKEDSYESVDAPLFRGVRPPTMAEQPLYYAPNPAAPPATLGAVAQGTQLFGSRSQAYDVTNENRAIFAEATYAVSDKFDVTAGLRYTEDERKFTRIQTLFTGAFDPTYLCPGMPTIDTPMGPVATRDRCHREVEYDEVTPRVILSYDLADDIMLYGSYSVGYSSGGFNQDVRMRRYLPETSDNWELGAKTTLFDGKLRLNGTFFFNSYKNQQVTVGRLVDGQPTADLLNAGKAEILGFEFEVVAQLTETLSIASTGAYLEGDYKEFLVEDNVVDPVTRVESIEVRDLSNVEFGDGGSETSFDISLVHQVNLGGGSLSSSLGVSFKDDQFYTLENTPSSFVESYWLVDARITWQLSDGKTSISLWSTNLLDEVYVDNMINQSGTVEIGGTDPSLGMSADYWGDPRRTGLEIRYSL